MTTIIDVSYSHALQNFPQHTRRKHGTAQVGMAHLLCKSAVRPLATSILQGTSNVPVLPSATQLTCLSTLCAPPALTSLRDWHAKQHPWSFSKPQSSQRAFCSASSADAPLDTRPKVVFLGTPEVAADVLFRLLKASQQPDANFQVAGVVTQPAKVRKFKGGKARPGKPHPVQVLATEWLLPQNILTPEQSSDEAFLGTLAAMQPDVCLTAAYGQFLPKAFRDIPKYGTVNIHPSLLPKYRGAAPVQRALQEGATEVGVSLLYTVKKMDAGPVIAQETVSIDSGIQADQLLFHLFAKGTKLFLDNLNSILSGEAQASARKQDPGQVSYAHKIEKSECWLDWDDSATDLHNQVRAFTPWPGAKQSFLLRPNADSEEADSRAGVEAHSIKIVKTVVGKAEDWQGKDSTDVTWTKEAMHIRCNDGSVLSVLQLQMPGKRSISPVEFANGALRNKTMHRTTDSGLEGE